MLFTSIFLQGERSCLRPLARATSRSADGYMMVLVPATLAIAGATGVAGLLWLIGLGLLIERSVYWVLKNTLKRPRPQEAINGFSGLIIAGDRFSFPSGHTSAAFFLATCTALVYQEPALALFPWAVCVGLSRVILGVHYPGDIIAGALMGSTIALMASTALGV